MARELVIKITGDATGLQQATDDAAETVGRFGQKIGALSVAAGNLLADGISRGVGMLGGFLSDSIGAGSDLSETTSKVGVLFGDAAGQVEAFAATAATTFGQSRLQAMDAAATFATFGKAAGLTGGDLSKFSTDFVGLASDLASFNNTSPEDAINAIGSALRGEAEPMRRFGVLLDDASMRQKAFELGIISTTKDALTPQQKVLAAQALIYAQTGAAQGDFARTSGGLANQQRILAAQLENAKAGIGEKLLPAVLAITKFLNERLIPTLQAWAEKWGPKIEATLERFAGWIRRIVDLFRGGQWEQALGEIHRKAFDVFVAVERFLWTKALPALGRALLAIGEAFGRWVMDTAWPYLRDNLPQWLAAFGGWLAGTALPWLGEQMLGFAGLLGGWVVDATSALLANLPGWLGAFAEWVVGTAVPAVAGKALELGLALGGWVGDASVEMLKRLPGLWWDLQVWFVTEGIPAVFRIGNDLAAKLGEGVLAALTWMDDIARNIVDGLIRGLGKMAGKLRDAVGGFIADNIPGPVRDILGISSPSKLFAGFGENVAEGLVVGMRRGSELVAAAAGGLAGATVPRQFDGYQPAAFAGVPMMAAAGGGSMVVNITTGADPDAVVTAVQRYARRNGGVPW